MLLCVEEIADMVIEIGKAAKEHGVSDIAILYGVVQRVEGVNTIH